MERTGLRIEMKSWKVVDDKGKINVAGEYVVMMGLRPVATSQFNDEYKSTVINFPPELLVEVQELNARVLEVFITSFTK